MTMIRTPMPKLAPRTHVYDRRGNMVPAPESPSRPPIQQNTGPNPLQFAANQTFRSGPRTAPSTGSTAPLGPISPQEEPQFSYLHLISTGAAFLTSDEEQFLAWVKDLLYNRGFATDQTSIDRLLLRLRNMGRAVIENRVRELDDQTGGTLANEANAQRWAERLYRMVDWSGSTTPQVLSPIDHSPFAFADPQHGLRSSTIGQNPHPPSSDSARRNMQILAQQALAPELAPKVDRPSRIPTSGRPRLSLQPSDLTAVDQSPYGLRIAQEGRNALMTVPEHHVVSSPQQTHHGQTDDDGAVFLSPQAQRTMPSPYVSPNRAVPARLSTTPAGRPPSRVTSTGQPPSVPLQALSPALSYVSAPQPVMVGVVATHHGSTTPVTSPRGILQRDGSIRSVQRPLPAPPRAPTPAPVGNPQPTNPQYPPPPGPPPHLANLQQPPAGQPAQVVYHPQPAQPRAQAPSRESNHTPWMPQGGGPPGGGPGGPPGGGRGGPPGGGPGGPPGGGHGGSPGGDPYGNRGQYPQTPANPPRRPQQNDGYPFPAYNTYAAQQARAQMMMDLEQQKFEMQKEKMLELGRVEHFSGLDRSKWRGFIAACFVHFHSKPITYATDAAKIGFIRSHFKSDGPAGLYSMELMTQRPLDPALWVWADFIAEFGTRFGPIDAEDSAGQEMQKYKMKDSEQYDQWSIEWERLAAATKWNESALVFQLRHNICPRLNNALANTANPPRDLAGLKAFFTSADRNYWARQAEYGFQPRPTTQNYRPNSAGPRRYNSNAPAGESSSRPRRPQGPRVLSLTQDQRNDRIRRKVCLICESKDHWASNCPQRAQYGRATFTIDGETIEETFEAIEEEYEMEGEGNDEAVQELPGEI
ncbi:hypothetical protein ONZ45_g18443 [Pleurotus djamor]|nr:hypothetical protein ONZ45_g18443 [Pleurotus djamor]